MIERRTSETARAGQAGEAAPAWLGERDVHRLLDMKGCIAAVRAAMTALARDDRAQPLRSIADMGEGRLFGIMPGMVPGGGGFGAKLVGVLPDPDRPGRAVHHGAVALFGEDGAPLAFADAGAVTEIRTAAASAVATDALARPDAARLAIYGCGAQARTHILAITEVRPLERVGIWGRNPATAKALADEMRWITGLDVAAVSDPRALAEASDIICTVSASPAPILFGAWVRPGTHVNAVGSSYAGPVEVDSDLVAASRYIVDYRPSALAAAAEFLAARAAGLIGDGHIAGEIGEVLAGTVAGRRDADEITLYKSLGHVVQDLAAIAYAVERSRAAGGAA